MEEQKEVPQEKTLIQQAEDVAKRLEDTMKRTEDLLKRNEEIISKSMLSGRSAAGATIPQVNPEDKLKQDMKEYFKGSAIEKMIK